MGCQYCPGINIVTIKMYVLFFGMQLIFGCKEGERRKVMNYFPNGDIRSSIEYKLNNKDTIYDGLIKYYFPKGKIHQEFEFRDGRKNGKHKIFEENGKVAAEVSYRNDLKDGYARFYTDTGANYLLFRNDTILKSKSFYPNGLLKSIYIFHDSHSLRYLLELDSFGNKTEELGKIEKLDTIF